MKQRAAWSAAMVLSCTCLVSEAQVSEKGRYAVGGGYSGSTVAFDVSRNGGDVTFDGWAVFGRIGLSERWGIQLSYRRAQDDEKLDAGEEISLESIGVHSYWIWGRTKYTNWHAKFGFSWAEFESKIPSVGSSSDSGLGPSIGVGFDWGSKRFAFFVDFGVTIVEIELIPDREESLTFGSTIIGFVYKF